MKPCWFSITINNYINYGNARVLQLLYLIFLQKTYLYKMLTKTLFQCTTNCTLNVDI